jgi:hypothetical protein
MSDVPAQFRGEARAYMQRVILAGGVAAEQHRRMIKRMNVRLDRGAMLRPEHIKEIECVLHAMDTLFALDLQIKWIKKKTLEVGLLSLGTGRGSDLDWRAEGEDFTPYNSERGLLLITTGMMFAPRRLHVENRTVAMVGHHALARRFQRGFRNDDASVRSDLIELVDLETLRKHIDFDSPEFAIPVAGGRWRGNWIEVQNPGSSDHGQHVLRVRTFFSRDEEDD